MTAIAQKSVLAGRLMMLFIAAGLTIGFGHSQTAKPPLPAQPPVSPQTDQPLPLILGPRAHDTRLTIDLSDRVVYLHHKNQLIASYRVAIGQKGWETPIGQFRIRQMIAHPTWQHPLTDEIFPPGAQNPLGDRWIGFTADQTMKIGFHGTREERLLGQAVSHGCVRMKNRDIRDLYDRVSLGTPVIVRP